MRQDTIRSLKIFAILALAFGALSVAFKAGWMFVVTPLGKVLPSAVEGLGTSPALAAQTALFLMAGIAIHLMLAVAWFLVWRPFETRFGWQGDKQRNLAVLSFLLVLFWILLANGRWHPHSMLAAEFTSVPGAVLWEAAWWTVSAGLALAIASAAIIHATKVLRLAMSYSRVAGSAIAMVLVVTAVAAGAVATAPVDDGTGMRERPDIIIIGIDSLRRDHVGRFRDDGATGTPAIDGLLEDAAVFDHAWTPLGRTFPAWVSILTGQYPSTHGAIYNLIHPDRVDASDTLAHRLGTLGYRRIYAIDETRFSNLDERFGFDEIIGPPIGAADFLIGTVHDLPLVNLVGGTSAGRVLFPTIHMNRALPVTYRPDAFDRQVAAAIERQDAGDPLFMVVHFELPHWPYRWADSRVAETHPSVTGFESSAPTIYRAAVAAADRQVAALTATLAANDRLRNALVVVLTDHGEGFAMHESPWTAMSGEQDFAAIRSGHGTSVLNPAQNRVVLAFRTFGAAHPGIVPGGRDGPMVSLVDVRATIEEWLGLPVRPGQDGVSRLPVLLDVDWQAAEPRAVAIESGFSPPGIDFEDPDAIAIAWENARYYSVDPAGRLMMKDEWIDYHLERKQRGVVSGEWLLAMMPDSEGEEPPRLILANHRTRQYWDMRVPPAPPTAAPVTWLLEELCRRLSGGSGSTIPECSC